MACKTVSKLCDLYSYPSNIKLFLDKLHENILYREVSSNRCEEIIRLSEIILKECDEKILSVHKYIELCESNKERIFTSNRLYENFKKFAKTIAYNNKLYEDHWNHVMEWNELMKKTLVKNKLLFLHTSNIFIHNRDYIQIHNMVASYNNNEFYLDNDGKYLQYKGCHPKLVRIVLRRLRNIYSDCNDKIILNNITENDCVTLTPKNNLTTILVKNNNILAFKWGGHIKNKTCISFILTIKT